MLPLDIIRKYYPNTPKDELKEIQEVVYLLACAVMQQFYGHDWISFSGDEKYKGEE